MKNIIKLSLLALVFGGVSLEASQGDLRRQERKCRSHRKKVGAAQKDLRDAEKRLAAADRLVEKLDQDIKLATKNEKVEVVSGSSRSKRKGISARSIQKLRGHLLMSKVAEIKAMRQEVAELQRREAAKRKELQRRSPHLDNLLSERTSLRDFDEAIKILSVEELAQLKGSIGSAFKRLKKKKK